jgi:hypothetical protein
MEIKMSTTATTMKLSKKTLDILKNFSSINASLFTKSGNKLYTISPTMTIVAEATIEETFDTNFCIYDLSKFLGVVSLFDSPEFEFEKKYVTISGANNSNINYHFCEQTLLDRYVKNYGNVPQTTKKVYGFEITSKQIDNLKRAASLLELNTIKISASPESGIDVTAIRDDNATPNFFNINIEDGQILDKKAEPIYIDISLMNLYPGTYTVEVGGGSSTKWVNKDQDITYYIVIKKLKA